MAESVEVLRQSPTELPQVIEVRNPATLTKVGEVPVLNRDEVAAAVSTARQAQEAWRHLSCAERARVLYRFRDCLIDHKDRVADVVTSETGKPRAEVYTSELFYVCDAITFWGKRAVKYLRDEKIRPHLLKTKRVYVSYIPMGVVGIIGPWNFPFTLTIGEAIPALMAGNAVVIKPSEVTPCSAMLGVQLAREVGLPEGLLQTVTGYGETGAHLIDCADMICFTGSVATGKKVMERAARTLKPVTLELGGKDPMIVLRDADLERAANACVWGGLTNSGQVCTSVERVYIEEPVYDSFVQKVLEKVRGIRQGMSDQDVDLGSMTFPPQIAKVERHIADAVARGAKVLTGGKRTPGMPGLFFEPTVLVDVNHDMEIMRDETFGPVIPMVKVKDAEEALHLANDTRYGLNASIWTKHAEKGRALARRIEAGCVCVNDCMVNFAVIGAPMGGVKESGWGRRHGAQGIQKFCHQQTVLMDRLGLRSEPQWYPMTAAKAKLFRRMLNLLFRSGWRNKLTS